MRGYLVPQLARTHAGEMAEWLKAHAWKACIGETLSRVRIPLSPPLQTQHRYVNVIDFSYSQVYSLMIKRISSGRGSDNETTYCFDSVRVFGHRFSRWRTGPLW